jgi:hypothetical protein
MNYKIILYQIEYDKNKELIDYITNDLKEFNPSIDIDKYDVKFDIDIYGTYKCHKIINKFIKYKNKIEKEYDDYICIYIEIR